MGADDSDEQREHTCTHAGVSTSQHVCYCALDRDHQSWESA